MTRIIASYCACRDASAFLEARIRRRTAGNPDISSFLWRWLHLRSRFAFVNHKRIYQTGWRIADILEVVNRTSWIVPGLPRRETARLLALDNKLDGALDDGAIAVARMSVMWR
jgi:hypothetical protein